VTTLATYLPGRNTFANFTSCSPINLVALESFDPGFETQPVRTGNNDANNMSFNLITDTISIHTTIFVYFKISDLMLMIKSSHNRTPLIKFEF
jgi:hypothetical protein